MYDPKLGKVFFSRDVLFNETKFNRIEKVKNTGEIEESPVVELVNNEMHAEELTEDTELHEQRPSRASKAPEYYGEWVNAVSENIEPVTLREALSGPKSREWTDAMTNEIGSLAENDVWDLVTLPEGRKAIGSKWIYKTKLDADGNIERYKARLVAQGFNQKYGIDYDETFSPVVRFESIRTVIALAANYALKVHQMDVKTAFLNGELKEEIFMKQPEGFVSKGEENLVCKLQRSIYGLKQSARCWNTELDNQLKKMEFIQSKSDPCIYTQNSG